MWKGVGGLLSPQAHLSLGLPLYLIVFQWSRRGWRSAWKIREHFFLDTLNDKKVILEIKEVLYFISCPISCGEIQYTAEDKTENFFTPLLSSERVTHNSRSGLCYFGLFGEKIWLYYMIWTKMNSHEILGAIMYSKYKPRNYVLNLGAREQFLLTLK